MTQEIKFSGISTIPDDYEAPDGQLDCSLNLINEDGALKPVLQPKPILHCGLGGAVRLIHHVPGQDNYIIFRSGHGANSLNIFWLEKTDVCQNEDDATIAASYIDCLDIAIIGNTLVIATSQGLRYLLWKDGKYIPLKNRPPFISIDFGMYKAGTLSDHGNYDIPSRCSPSWDPRRGSPDNDQLAEFTQTAYGLLLKSIADNVTTKGYFYQPFFVRYAYRLYDGSYSWHSAPILMLPSILPPFIKYSDDGNPSGDTITAELRLKVPYFGLAYRILSFNIEELSHWTDLVSGIDVFISPLIYTWDQSKDITNRPVLSTRELLGYVTTDRDSLGSLPDEVFIGHYADRINGEYVDHTMKTSNTDNPDYSDAINIKPHERMISNIQDAHTFYKVAEIDIKDIRAMTEMAQLKILEPDLTSLSTRPELSDDYQSHCNLVAKSLYVFNSRLNLAGVSIAPPEPLPIRSVMQYGNPDGAAVARTQIKVWTRINGVRCIALHSGSDLNQPDTWHNPAANFPRYIYYPDASAYKMEILVSGREKYIVNLTRHDFLNGAYFFRGKEGIGSKDPKPANAEPETAACHTSVNIGPKIYTSEVNNPFLFPLLGINTVGTGEVMAVCSAAKALSQGQFGQFPLYAFTTEGVWALETTSAGTYYARQPITRDVCTSINSITQLDSSVLFATARGIMLLSGSSAQCISDSIATDTPFNILGLPGIDNLHAMLGDGHKLDTCIPAIPFSAFLDEKCGMIYDYVHQRVIVFNPDESYAYVFSLKSRQWGMMYSNIRARVNSYPDALAADTNSDLVNFALRLEHQHGGLLVTRSLKLEAPDILKTVNAVIQRGNFAKGHVQSVLYGSRDLINWHLVWSSRDHFMRGFSGTPYKYFRIACLAELTDGESLSGASFKFTPRLTNQLR